MIPKEMQIGPPKPKRKRTSKKDLEGTVIRECLKALKASPAVAYVERRNTGAAMFQGGGFVRFGRVGSADIWCLVQCNIPCPNEGGAWACPRLTHVEIECKRADGKGRQSPDQKRFQELCDNRGIPYILTTSAQELMVKIGEISSC